MTISAAELRNCVCGPGCGLISTRGAGSSVARRVAPRLRSAAIRGQDHDGRLGGRKRHAARAAQFMQRLLGLAELVLGEMDSHGDAGAVGHLGVAPLQAAQTHLALELTRDPDVAVARLLQPALKGTHVKYTASSAKSRRDFVDRAMDRAKSSQHVDIELYSRSTGLFLLLRLGHEQHRRLATADRLLAELDMSKI